MSWSWEPRSKLGVIAVIASALIVDGTARAVRSVLRMQPPGNPDRGNRRLRVLAADPVFEALPPGAIRTSWQEKPPYYVEGFFTGSWHGPSVTLTFTSTEPASAVYGFYAERAEQADWAAWQKQGGRGYTYSWKKTIAGKESFLSLLATGPESGASRSYSLTGST